MKKIPFLLIAALITTPVLANEYGDEYDTYDDEVDTYSSASYDTPKSEKRETYAGLRIHRNEHISFKYTMNDGGDATVRSDNFGLGLNIGNRLTDNVKIEFETLYAGASEKKDATTFGYDIWSNMLNVYIYDTFGGAVEPYLGIGMGVSGIWADIKGMYNAKDSDFKLSFALMTGINFALNKYVDLNLGLRYVDYGKMEFDNATAHIRATEAYIGAAYKFGIFN